MSSTFSSTHADAPFTPSVMPATRNVLQRKCGCGRRSLGGECSECQKKHSSLQRKRQDVGHAANRSPLIPPIVDEVLSSAGQPLDTATRAFQESVFKYDFSNVRVHTDEKAAASAQAVDAAAYTVGRDVVFGAGQYAPATESGQRLMTHELTHVLQQRNSVPRSQGYLQLGEPDDRFEREADASSGSFSSNAVAERGSPLLSPMLQRTMICARPLESSRLAGFFANHSWIDDTGRDDCRGAGLPQNYAVMDLVRGDPERGCATKTDRSPDPSVSEPRGKPCRPRTGVTDVHACLRTAFNNYADPGFYSTTHGVIPGVAGGAAIGGAGLGVGGAYLGSYISTSLGSRSGTGGAIAGGIVGGLLGLAGGALAGMRIAGGQVGPNSNTFAGTLARACCDDPSDSGLGWVPGWDKPAAEPCPGDI